MGKFLVLYASKVSAADQMASTSPEQAEAGMKLWMDWAQQNGQSIVDLGMPLNPVGRIQGESVNTSDSATSGFSIMQAESTDDVLAILKDHPHLHSPGDPTIEVLEFLSLPGM